MDFLFFDVETVIDKDLLAAVKYPGLAPDVALIRARTEAACKSNGDSDWINAAFHRPVCVAVLTANSALGDATLSVLEGDGVMDFWTIMVGKSAPSTLVSFNGRAFDLPVLELAAMRDGVRTGAAYWNGSRDRYRSNHVDLKDVFDNRGSCRLAGGLDLLAKLCGNPGKMSTTGADVEDLVAQGCIARVREYCCCDVLETYLLYLRWLVVRGEVALPAYDAARAACVGIAERTGTKEGPLGDWAVKAKVLADRLK